MKTITQNIKTKTLAIAVTLCSLSNMQLVAQSAEEVLKTTFTAFDTAKVYNQKMQLVSQFKLIAGKWSTNWLTNYYAAFAITVTSFDETDKKKREAMLDEADMYFEKIKSMASNNE